MSSSMVNLGEKETLTKIEQELKRLHVIRGMRFTDYQLKLINEEISRHHVTLQEVRKFCDMARRKSDLGRRPIYLQIIEFAKSDRGVGSASGCSDGICAGNGYIHLINKNTGGVSMPPWCSCKLGASEHKRVMSYHNFTDEHYSMVSNYSPDAPVETKGVEF